MSINHIRALATVVALLAFSAAMPAWAGVIAILDAGIFVQSGTLRNLHSSNITSMEINFVPDAGGNTPIYDTGTFGGPGSPMPDFSNPVPGLDAWFTATFNGLNVANGGIFEFFELDYDGFDSSGMSNVGNGTTTPIDGSEFVKLTFADGSMVASFMPVGVPTSGFRLTFVSVPEPSVLSLLGVGLAALGFRRRKKVA